MTPTSLTIERLEPLCDEFEHALRVDVGYLIEIALAAARVERLKAVRKARREAGRAQDRAA